MVIDEKTKSSGPLKDSTETAQIESISTDESALIMTARSTVLEARYQQLLEQRIAVLERQLAPPEPVKVGFESFIYDLARYLCFAVDRWVYGNSA